MYVLKPQRASLGHFTQASHTVPHPKRSETRSKKILTSQIKRPKRLSSMAEVEREDTCHTENLDDICLNDRKLREDVERMDRKVVEFCTAQRKVADALGLAGERQLEEDKGAAARPESLSHRAARRARCWAAGLRRRVCTRAQRTRGRSRTRLSRTWRALRRSSKVRAPASARARRACIRVSRPPRHDGAQR